MVLRLRKPRLTCPEARAAALTEQSLSERQSVCPEGCAPQTHAPKQPPLAAIARCPAQGIPACVSPLIHGPWVAAHLAGHPIGQGVCSIIWPPGGNLGMLFPRENLHLSWASLPRGRPLLPVHCFKHLVGFRKRAFRGREA